jgi:hypothetical protein
VLRNDPSGSGGEGAFDVRAAKRPEVNESRIAAGSVREWNLILLQTTGWHARDSYNVRGMHRFLLAGRPFHCVPIGVERTPRRAESSRRSAL